MKSEPRQFSVLDRFLIQVDQGLKTVLGRPVGTGRANPADDIINPPLSKKEIRHAAGLMRINQTGEVAAQALYQGQAITARHSDIRQVMQQAALEENDHLLWCNTRIVELNSHRSMLNPLWYTASFGLGLIAGLCGDKWSLGFLAETEKQVGIHLQTHLHQLPQTDYKSRAIVTQMWEDETHHESVAIEQGGVKLPLPIRVMMKFSAKMMTSVVYYV